MTCPHYTEVVHPDYCVFCREEELRAEVERLTASLECWKGRAMNYVTDIERLHRHSDEIHELRAEIELLRAALKPFAKVASEWDDEDISLEVELRAYDDRPGPGINVADFRKARAALEQKP